MPRSAIHGMARSARAFFVTREAADCYAGRLRAARRKGRVALFRFAMKHLLSLEEMTGADMRRVLDSVVSFKSRRATHPRPLQGQTWALIFSKSSTRTRVSFEVGLRELGAEVLFLNANDIQLGRGEPIRDTARVLGRMLHGAVIRTFAQEDVEIGRAHV